MGFVLKQGVTRNVLKVGGWAFKFPRLNNWKMFLQGLVANLNEVDFNRWLLPLVVEIRFALPGGFLNVSKWAEPLTPDEAHGHYAELVQSASMNPDDARLSFLVEVLENKTDSFGKLGQVIVILDYGF